MKEITRRNTSIEALRFVLICVICLWHCHSLAPSLTHGGNAVEFYFILSGFFIYRAYCKKQKDSTLEYTKARMKKFFVPSVLSILALMLLDRKQYIFLNDFSADGILSTYYNHLYEFIFCQSIGISNESMINRPIWFVSVLLTGGGLLYSCLKNNGVKAINFILPIFCLCSFSYILLCGNNDFESGSKNVGLSLVRGTADMGLGIITSYLFTNYQQSLISHKHLFDIFSVICIVGFVLSFIAQGNYGQLMLVFIPVMICNALLEGTILQRTLGQGFWIFLGSLSMYMYFIHLFIANVYFIIADKPIMQSIPVVAQSILYLLIVMTSAFVLKFVTVRLNKKLGL